jgi:hypothetical protein
MDVGVPKVGLSGLVTPSPYERGIAPAKSAAPYTVSMALTLTRLKRLKTSRLASPLATAFRGDPAAIDPLRSPH